MTYQSQAYQFKTRFQEDNRNWEDIPFTEADFNSPMGAGIYAQDILGNDPHKTIREIRYNAKGSLQGHYVAGTKRMTVFDRMPLPLSSTETNPSQAHTLEQMQQVAHNQIQFKIWELEERLSQLEAIKSQIETVVDWDSYERLIGNIDEDDNEALTALTILGNEGQTIRNGGYF